MREWTRLTDKKLWNNAELHKTSPGAWYDVSYGQVKHLHRGTLKSYEFFQGSLVMIQLTRKDHLRTINALDNALLANWVYSWCTMVRKKYLKFIFKLQLCKPA